MNTATLVLTPWNYCNVLRDDGMSYGDYVERLKATWSTVNPDGRWRFYEYDELIACDKASPGIFSLRDDSLADSDNLQPPEVIAQEIVDDLEAALEQIRLIAGDLGSTEEEKI